MELRIKNGVVQIDKEDLPLVEAYSWRVVARGRKKGQKLFYAATSLLREGRKRQPLLLMHRLIHPEWKRIDHRDGDGLNNQRSNLRLCTQSQNNANSRGWLHSTSGVKGVHASGNNGRPWKSAIDTPNGRRYLGVFDSIDSAKQAYLSASREEFGEFAKGEAE